MKIPNKRYEGKTIKKLVIVPSRFGYRWRVTTEDGHTTYPIDGWKTRKEALKNFFSESTL